MCSIFSILVTIKTLAFFQNQLNNHVFLSFKFKLYFYFKYCNIYYWYYFFIEGHLSI